MTPFWRNWSANIVGRLEEFLGFAGSGLADISQLKRIDQDGRDERRIRFAVLGSMAVLVLLLDGSWLPLLWVPAYFGALHVNSRLIKSMPDKVSRSGMAGLAVALFTDSALYFMMATYLWAQGTALHTVLGLMMVAGYMLNATTEHCEDPLMVLVDIAASGLAVLAMGTVGLASGVTGAPLIFAALVVLSAYFAHSVLNTMWVRRRYRDAQQRLAESKKMDAIGHLTGGLAHDYNNVLTAVIGNLELSQSVSDPIEKDNLTRAAQNSALEAARLTSQVMAVARRAHIQPESIQISSLFQSLWPRLRRTLPASVSLVMQTDPPDLTVFADRTHLEQVLLELGYNARDAIEGTGKLSLAAHIVGAGEIPPLQGGGEPSGADYIAIVVSDTGIGMTEETKEQATEPFFTTRPPGQSSGLGLSVARGLTEQMGGGLRIDSLQRQGTTVTLILPRFPISVAGSVRRA